MTVTETSPVPLNAERLSSVSSGPYVGPRPFEKNEEHLFFGRDREARDLISLIIANRVFVLYSQSGAGKSSLLNTKIIAGLEKEGCLVLPIARVQGKVPKTTNEAEIRNIFSLNTILSLRDAVPNLELGSVSSASIAEFIAAIHPAIGDSEDPIVLIFDQFEELFSFYEYRWPDRLVFLREIAGALEKFAELKVVLSLREDYIAKLDAYSDEFPNKLRARYHLERLQEAAATEAIVNPAETSRRRYADGVAEAVVLDLLETRSRDVQGNTVTVRGEFVEPVQLQVVCSNLWSSVPASETLITKTHLEQSGNVDEALRKFYEGSLAHVSSKTHVSELEIRQWFENALVTSAGTRGTVFRDTDVTAGMPNQVVDALEDRHLIRGDWRAGAQWYEITHDRLLRPIRESNRIWQKKAARSRWLKAGSAAGLVAVAIVATLVWSLNKNREASQREMAATLVEASSRLPQNSLDLALLLAVEAYRASDSTSTRSNLLSQVLRADRVERLIRVSRRDDLGISVKLPGKDLVASVTSDRSLIVWDRSGQTLSVTALEGEAPFGLFADESFVYAVPARGEAQVFSSDSLRKAPINDVADQLKSGQAQNPTANIAPLDLEQALQRDTEVRRTVALAAGRLLIARGNEIVVSNIQDHSEIARFRAMETSRPVKILDVGLSSDGKFAFARGCEIDEARADKATASPPQTRALPVISLCGRRTQKFWQIDSKRELFAYTLPSGAQSIAIDSSNGNIRIAAGNADGSVTVGDFQIQEGGQSTTTTQLTDISLSVSVPIADLLFSDNSNRLISVSGGQAISWNLNGPSRLARKIRDGLPFDLATGGDDLIANVGANGYSVLAEDGQRELFAGTIPRSLGWEGEAAELAGVALAPGKLLVGQYGLVELWDIVSRQKLVSIDINPAATLSVAIDPLGKFIASGFLPLWIRDARNKIPSSTDYSRVPVLWTISDRQPALFIDLSAKTPAPKESSSGNPGANAPGYSQKEDNKPMLAVAVTFSPDGKKLFVTKVGERGDGNVEIYTRIESGERTTFVKSEAPPIAFDGVPFFITFSKDGRLLAVSREDGAIFLFDAATMRQIGRLPTESNEGGRLAISRDNSFLATNGSGGWVNLWDIERRTPFGRPIKIGNTRAPTGVALSQDNRWLFAADPVLNSLVSFDLNPQSWIKQACEVAGRELLKEERESYRLPAKGSNTCVSR